jgi:hypothetical protein
VVSSLYISGIVASLSITAIWSEVHSFAWYVHYVRRWSELHVHAVRTGCRVQSLFCCLWSAFGGFVGVWVGARDILVCWGGECVAHSSVGRGQAMALGSSSATSVVRGGERNGEVSGIRFGNRLGPEPFDRRGLLSSSQGTGNSIVAPSGKSLGGLQGCHKLMVHGVLAWWHGWNTRLKQLNGWLAPTQDIDFSRLRRSRIPAGDVAFDVADKRRALAWSRAALASQERGR